ncbi:Ac45/VOA1 transmembrane domain-containing protein [Aspergillus saccharolyticus JOP 1030-1]|uniref:Protein BIG1 n=1 Tax=Aspergillus saccharolyticus JOP 1030-1 TaxID=1450539 RepID=A0A318ZI77_9EURO|nr:BIG1-domain-containing protein [Aspergillus saccharolyticus JOP 1030-1]PYH43400.1 BIG1-domain-containing protein [Aspergillus saccharolyticus JOP 1030-1]
MRLGTLSLLALGATTASAYRDTSPFFLASTSENLSTSAQLKTASSLLEDLSSKLSGCPSDYYIIASQPGVHSNDFSALESAPRLGAKLTGKDRSIRSKTILNEVLGVLDATKVQELIEAECGAQSTIIDASTGTYSPDFGAAPRIIRLDFSVLPQGPERRLQLTDNDGLLSDVIDRLPDSKKYTILYITSPKEIVNHDAGVYQSEDASYQDPIHMELKRDFSAHGLENDVPSNKTLFREYHYFTPGIIMGLIASIFCLLILYVGLSALLSLEVPYAAFEKDTAASVHKKQQ